MDTLASPRSFEEINNLASIFPNAQAEFLSLYK
jgi:hypothetical protein